MPLANALLAEMEQEAKTTQRVLERIPEDKVDWKPHPRSMSIGELGMHIAYSPLVLSEVAVKDVHELGLSPKLPPPTRQAILDTFAKSTQKVKDVVGSFDDGKMASTITMTKDGKTIMAIPRAGFIRAIMMNHIYHHRGQLSVYLRLLDVPVPSIYGSSADEKVF
jgi:uncharacterized damage-inducible protein DinB